MVVLLPPSDTQETTGMAPPLLGPPVSAPRDPVSPAEDDEEHDRDEGGEVEPMIGPRRTMLGDRGGRGSSVDVGSENDVNDCDDLLPGSPSIPPWSLQDRLVQLLSTWSPASLRHVAPVQVSTELGISVEDATAELCRLLASVGNDSHEEEGGGATFSFVRLPLKQKPPSVPNDGKAAAPARPLPDHVTMVFSFPKDFQRRARRNRRRSDLADTMRELGVVLFRAVKVVTALGLFASLLIVAVVATMAALVALVTMSRHGFSANDAAGGRHLRQHVRSLCDVCRNCLWCYAVFMPAGAAGGGAVGFGAPHDPFLRELAADLSLLCGCLRGSPLSLWYWLTFRRHRWRRQPTQEPYQGMVRVGTWGTPGEEEDHDHDPNRLMGAAGERSGLLGVAAEFLFGPTPFSPGPTPAEKWRLRARVIVDKCGAESASGAVSLAELGPFVDDPPASIRDPPKVVSHGLVLVSHFRGVPTLSASTSDSMDVRGSPQSTFLFPELMAESAHLSGSRSSACGSEVVDATWTKNLFYQTEPSTAPSRSARALSATSPTAKVPSFLVEKPYRLTRLTQLQFVLCAFLVTVNGLGVLWLRQSICKGGALSGASRTALGYLLCRVAVPVLHFYSILFVALPLGRLALIVLWNAQIQRRNRRRRNLARELESS